MGGEAKMDGEAALIRAVRALDKGGIEAVPESLDRVWKALSQHRGGGKSRGGFHAADEMLLRWLLKHMTGNSAAAERVRRYPPAWDLMGAVFDWIPLFSLAKTLADRRFVGILQQTLKDISKPQVQAPDGAGKDSDVEMADAPTSPSRKRKRSAPVTFDPARQRQTTGCLRAGESVLAALRALLARCESIPVDESPNNRMGAEHVKSLFSSSAAEVMEVLVPIITLCGLAAENDAQEDSSIEQSSWISTFTALWDLHLQSTTDASEVAKHLAGFTANLLGKLVGIPVQKPLSIGVAVQQRWARDLRRFLTRNMILPSRSAFVDKRGQEIMQVAVDMSSATFTTSFPVLFDLISKSPRVFGDRTSKKDYETWMQSAFDALMAALKPHGKQALPAVEVIIEMAAEREAPLSLSSLREVCKDYALQAGSFAWKLLLSIIRLNPDVFLIGPEGQGLLEQILEKTRNSGTMSDGDFDKALQFVVLLVQGYARARDLSTFLKIWLRYLAVAEPNVTLERLWSQKEVVSAVASVLQDSLNPKQLVDITKWLSERTEPAEKLGRIHILGAISSGVTDEELIDLVSMKTFDGSFQEKVSKKESPAISVSRWLITENALSRGTLAESANIWSQVKSNIDRILRKSAITEEGTFAAFKCCVAAWLANHPQGADEEEAAAMTCTFLKRLEKDKESESSDAGHPITKGTYVSWILSGNSRLVVLLVKRNKAFPESILSLISLGNAENPVTFDAATAVIPLIINNENQNNDVQLMHGLVEQMIALLDPSQAKESLLSTRVAVQFLLDIPVTLLTRPQRETAMERLVSQLLKILDLSDHIEVEYWKPVLSLMRKLMEQPTFYPDMSFKHLDTIGKRLFKLYRQSKEKRFTDSVLRAREDLALLGRLATLTIEQMDSGNPEEREKGYITEAVSVLQSPCKDSDMVPRLVLLHTFISAAQASQTLENLREGGLDLNDLKRRLLEGVKPIITAGKWRGRALLSLLVAQEATNVLDGQVIRESFASAVPSLVQASQKLLEKISQAGWEVRMFLARYFVEELGSPLKIKFHNQGAADDEDGEEGSADHTRSTPALVDGATLSQYVDVAVRDINDETKLKYLEDLLREQGKDRLEERSRLFVILSLVQHLAVARGQAMTTKSGFDLAQAHSILCSKLSQSSSSDPEQFVLTAQTLHLLLDQKGVCMTQWNIDLTLSTVATICCAVDEPLSSKRQLSDATLSTAVSSSSTAYKWLCSLVEIIIKRHRKRLDGHFHLLITTLESLLRHLLLLSSRTANSHISKKTSSEVLEQARQLQHQERNARLFSRLLTLICEPTVASVTRHHKNPSNKAENPTSAKAGGQPMVLDSEKDRAKRYAGQFMYLVVMHYIRLQLQLEKSVVVTGEAREALEVGMFSILDITSKPDGLRILTDAMDGSGRVIFREMYKRYERFGKWSGV